KRAHREPTDAHKERVQLLFIMLKGNYDWWKHKLSEEELKESKREWVHMLRRYTDKQVQDGYKKCVRHYKKESGPNLGTFMDFCEIPEAHKNFDMSKALPAPNRVNQSVGESALDEIKRKLNMK
ncbi:MAG: hypothetical protein JKY50_12925, partial [Oleispira sp.]|nr:hypothetical protein [Oleispira sp.]